MEYTCFQLFSNYFGAPRISARWCFSCVNPWQKKPGEERTNNAQTTGGSDEWQSPLGPGLLTVRFGPDLAGMEKLGPTKSWGILFKEKRWRPDYLSRGDDKPGSVMSKIKHINDLKDTSIFIHYEVVVVDLCFSVCFCVFFSSPFVINVWWLQVELNTPTWIHVWTNDTSSEETVSHPNNLQISEVSLQIFGNFFTGNLTGESTLDAFKSDASQ